MTTIYLKPHKEESLRRQHPWVFSGAIARVALDKDYPFNEPKEGELVCVRSSGNDVLGVGHWQVGSIAVRILAFGVERLPEDFWEERIRAAYRVREGIGLITLTSPHPSPQGRENNTFRLVHGEGDFLPGLIVDVYAETAVIQAHSIGMHLCRETIAAAIVKNVPQVKNVYYKSDDTLPRAFGNKLALTDRRAVIGATCASALRLECHCVSTLIGCYAAQQSDISGDFCCKMCLDRCLLFKSA